jgi:hypothetical protein
MPDTDKKTSKQKKPGREAKKEAKAEKSGSRGHYWIAIIAAVVVIAVVVGYLFVYSGNGEIGGGTITFSEFLNEFYASPRIAIYVNGNSTWECGEDILQLLPRNIRHPRNSSTVDYYILNSTTCTKVDGLGYPGATTSNFSRASCMANITKEPSIFINYSSVNATIIRHNYLYFGGDAAYLNECGIAYEIG